MSILVTGSAGFIGFYLAKRLLKSGNKVIGIDNINDYYSTSLKLSRLKILKKYSNYKHFKIDITNEKKISEIFQNFKPRKVINLAAQAGVRYSLENPSAYINSNLVGFSNILENCRNYKVKHLVYASSSSIYGANTSVPYSVQQNTNHPLSLYAATKKSNELMAHSYSNLYKIPTTGLRFFTVYGPWDRPDMALQKFALKIIKGEKIKIFNNGNHKRDFTFIDDIVESIIRVLNKPAKPDSSWSGKNPNPSTSNAPWRIYNIGNNKPIKLMNYINALEIALGKKAKTEFISIQPGDVPNTWANVDELERQFNYKPNTSIEQGIHKFVNWFKNYYKI